MTPLLDRIRLIRNIGQFDSVADCANIPLLKLTLVYAENGRGKTTLSAILRSLGTGDPLPISERRRLGTENPPHVVVESASGISSVFQDGVWNQQSPDLAVFDDVFVDQNVYSGLSVEPAHRQHLHDLILGAQGVELGKTFQAIVVQNEENNRALRQAADAIPESVRGSLSPDQFCALVARPTVDADIQAAERTLAAARERDAVRSTGGFDLLGLPAFDLEHTRTLLLRGMPALDTVAATRIQAHLAGIGPGGEAWVSDGMRRMQPNESCPFCAQDLCGSALVDHYRAYFSEGYNNLKQAIATAIAELDAVHGGPIPAAFERGVRVWGERQQFWSRFCSVPEIGIDTAAVARAWQTAREAIRALLVAKQGALLERVALSPEATATVAAFDGLRQRIASISQNLQAVNGAVRVVKEQAAAGNVSALTADVARLKAVKERHSPATASLCQTYLIAKTAKAEADIKRVAARSALDNYRLSVFPSYQIAINLYLGKFGAGFRLADVASVTNRGGSACTYSVAIGASAISVAGAGTPGSPSFRSTLSAGDRNTLALAFFFASLDQDPNIGSKVVVIDDPITSLDEHRSLTTVQELGRLAQRAAQLIVLSHSKPFLCELWDGADRDGRLAVQITRQGAGSTLGGWIIHHDLVTEHDRRHALLRAYLESSVPDNRKVAEALRFVLEKFVRVAYPEYFGPGDMLGKFVNLCRQRIGSTGQILDGGQTQELDDILSYANKFHHETNNAYETEAVNDGELVGFARRTLAFTRH